MREYVEIGMGRKARQAYRLAQVNVVPTRRTRSSKDVDTSWSIDAYSFATPFLSHPTDALATPEFVIEMDKQGGLGVINAEGLWGRHADLDEAFDAIHAAFLEDPDSGVVKKLQELHSAPIDLDLLAQRINQVRDSGATVAVRVSPQKAREMAPEVIKAGAELLVIQGSIISAEHVERGGAPLNLKEFIGELDVPVIAGLASNYTTALHLMRAGAVGVIVGSGSPGMPEATGIYTPMATLIADAAAARREYLDETGGRYVHVIADGEIDNSGAAITAIACGADAVTLGQPLAPAAEAGGRGLYWQASTAHPRFPRGCVLSEELFDDTPTLEQILHGPSTRVWGEMNYVGGLKRAMAKCGFTDLKSFQKVELSLSY